MTAPRWRQTLVAVLLLLVVMTAAMPTRADARRRNVPPFCVGVTNTYVEACVGSPYQTVAAIAAMVGLGMPL